MGAIRFPLRSTIPILQGISEMPQSMKAFLRDGFAVLNKVYPQHSDVLIKTAVEAVQSPYQVDESDFAQQLGIPTDHAGQLLSAITFITVLMSGRAENAEELVKAAIEGGIVSREHETTSLNFARSLVAQHDTIKRSLDSSTLATRVLPYMREFDMSIDLRLGFQKGKIGLVVPVVIAHIDTDAAHEEIWFQMQKRDVEKLVDDLGKVLKQLNEAERWAEQRTVKPNE